MTLSLDGLLKYTINLIIPKRPTKWHCINIANTALRSLVAGMMGCEEILQTAGYTEKEGTHIEFPEHIQEPDKTKLTILAAELLMAKLQVERMSSVPVSNTGMFKPIAGFYIVHSLSIGYDRAIADA